MAVDYKALATKKFTNWSPLFKRHREDADFFNMVSLTKKLLDANDHEIPNSVHVVLNDIATFTWEVETQLNSAEEDIKVTSEHKRFDTSYVERFIKAGFREADELLALKGMFPFDPFTDQLTFRRGSVASLSNFHIKDGKLISEIIPWDTGYFVIAHDGEGINYTATKFTRSEKLILSEYPKAEGKIEKDKDSELLYIIARDTSQVWIGDAKIDEKPNPLGYVPVVYHRVPMGSMLMDKDTIQYQGESGIFLIRLLYKELERIASIIQTQALKTVDQAYQIQKSPTDSAGNAVPQETVDELTDPGSVTKTDLGSRYELMPLGQLQAVYDRLYQIIQERMQRGTSQIYRNIANPPTATEIMMEAQEQGNIVLPRLNTRGLEKQDLAKMFIKQTIAACKKAKVQTVKIGNEDFDVSKLKGDFSIKFRYHFQDPRMDAARQALARDQKATGLIPDKDIRINTLEREDWQADERQLRWEEAERLSPIIKLNRTRRAVGYLADEGEPGAEEELKMITIQMIPALRQVMEGLMTPNMPEELKPTQPMIPVMPGETQRGGQPNV